MHIKKYFSVGEHATELVRILLVFVGRVTACLHSARMFTCSDQL